jgi:hypothetical protein
VNGAVRHSAQPACAWVLINSDAAYGQTLCCCAHFYRPCCANRRQTQIGSGALALSHTGKLAHLVAHWCKSIDRLVVIARPASGYIAFVEVLGKLHTALGKLK